MKELGKKQNILKKIGTLLFATIFCCSSLIACTHTTRGIQDVPINTPQPTASYVELKKANFSDGNMPPTGWEIKQTNQNETWFIDNSISSYPEGKPSATVHRGSNTNTELQDEWLITPSIDCHKYKNIYLTFHTYTCYYTTAWKRYIEFNVLVSTDGGQNWTNAWNFDDFYAYPKHFNDWTWYLQSIDLSSYASAQSDVKIGIQYYSNSTTEWDKQVFSVDDIRILGNGTVDFRCSAGGPYYWYWDKQNSYPLNPGVQFHGAVYNATQPLQWIWDFGDGNTSTFPKSTIYYAYHFYNDVGTYNVTLTIIDNKTTPPRVAFDTTTLKLFLLPPPPLDISIKKMGSLGIKANVWNNGSYNATFVNWTINMSWGPLQIFKEKTVGNGTCDCIVGEGTKETIRSKYYFFGFGRMHISIRANPENIPMVEKHFDGWKIGPLVFVLK
jgi:hypothetical protein